MILVVLCRDKFADYEKINHHQIIFLNLTLMAIRAFTSSFLNVCFQ